MRIGGQGCSINRHDMKTPKLVTKEWMAAKVAANPQHVIGRALCAIYARQTSEEQANSATIKANGIGFTAFDAEVGSMCAKYFEQFGVLAPWMLKMWAKPDSKGFPKIAKYHRQLNQIAVSKLLPQLI